MKQIVIISGKGGTGKTVITGAFATLAKNKVMADCDVDAADLHLLLHPNIQEKHVFKSGLTAHIDTKKCIQCGKCIAACRFSAIHRMKALPDQQAGVTGGETIPQYFVIDPVSCEGCGFCSIVCPVNAIAMNENEAGEWFISDTQYGAMVHAKLGVAEENSGKLVSLVRRKAKEIADENNADWVIIDGAPGIGCPVIASLSGIDRAVIVTEPTLSGLHDMDRVVRVAKHFKVPVLVIINKYDLNEEVATQIENYCTENNITLLGKLHFDRTIVEAVTEGRTIIEYADNETTKTIKSIWERLQEITKKD